jgi:hypothetical protein
MLEHYTKVGKIQMQWHRHVRMTRGFLWNIKNEANRHQVREIHRTDKGKSGHNIQEALLLEDREKW